MKLVCTKKNGYRGGSPYVSAGYGESVEMTDENAKAVMASDPGAFAKEGSAEASEAVAARDKAQKAREKTRTKPAFGHEK